MHIAMPEPLVKLPHVSAATLRKLDLTLFVLTLFGALIVYVAVMLSSVWWFVIGEVVCAVMWVGGRYVKAVQRRQAKDAGPDAPV